MSNTEPKKFQIKGRLDKMIVPIDKLANDIFRYTPDEYKDIVINHAPCGCLEGEDRNGKQVETPYWLELAKDYVDLSPLTPFHREVLFAAISAYEQGYRVLTFKMALNALTGTDKSRIWEEQYEAIREAIHKLMKTVITIDLKPLLTAFPKYKKRHTGKAELVSPLLPCRYLNVEINGQRALAVELFEESPLMTVAKIKKQLISYGTAPLVFPHQKNTENVIVLKNYLLRRIKLMKSAERKKGLNNSILFETLYEKCGFAKASKSEKQDAREIIIDILNHFKDSKVIENFEIEKFGCSYRSIIISL